MLAYKGENESEQFVLLHIRLEVLMSVVAQHQIFVKTQITLFGSMGGARGGGVILARFEKRATITPPVAQ